MAFIEYETKDQIGILTINRPEALNALNNEVITELGKTLDAVDLSTVRCLIVTGAGQKAFAAGADIAIVGGGIAHADDPAAEAAKIAERIH